jgi:hypothetical protein
MVRGSFSNPHEFNSYGIKESLFSIHLASPFNFSEDQLAAKAIGFNCVHHSRFRTDGDDITLVNGDANQKRHAFWACIKGFGLLILPGLGTEPAKGDALATLASFDGAFF